jgi:hypothetical protein
VGKRFSGRILGAVALSLALCSSCGGKATKADQQPGDAGQEPEHVCRYGGATYQLGQSFPDVDGCNTCSCEPEGIVGCTNRGCGQGCLVGGVTYVVGQLFPAPDGCGKCTCTLTGVTCDGLGCRPEPDNFCTFGGRRYAIGESFPSGDGCNTCTCSAHVHGPPDVACTNLPCPQTMCLYLGELRAAGESFPARDGCNTCQCSSDGSVTCTEKACPCKPTAEWWRRYVGTSPGQCALIDFSCPSFTKMFGNECGCGCEQAEHCPQYQSCVTPESCHQCPYSGIVMK